MWIDWVLCHVGRISGATEFARWDELRADKNAWLRAPYHVKAHQSRMGDAYSHCTTFQEVFDSVPCALSAPNRPESIRIVPNRPNRPELNNMIMNNIIVNIIINIII